jgi:hypothetical protein
VATLLAALPGDMEAVPKSVRPVSNAAFAVAKVRTTLTASACTVPCTHDRCNLQSAYLQKCLHAELSQDESARAHLAHTT